jgi:hypothetical protein
MARAAAVRAPRRRALAVGAVQEKAGIVWLVVNSKYKSLIAIGPGGDRKGRTDDVLGWRIESVECGLLSPRRCRLRSWRACACLRRERVLTMF